MKKRMLTVILILTIVMNIPGVVFAKELQSPSYYLNNENVEAIYYDENGEMIVIMRESPVVSAMETECTVQSEMCESINPMTRASDSIYKSTLGPINDSRELQARSEVNNDAIDLMWVSCTGFYTTGNEIGQDIKQSPSGFQCQVLTASVKVPSSPYDSFRVGSGYSIHQYRDSRYKPVDHFLKWNLEN